MTEKPIEQHAAWLRRMAIAHLLYLYLSGIKYLDSVEVEP
jgi:hypothetical protein